MNVLFTNAGRRTYLVQFALDLQQSGYPIEVHVSDCNAITPTMHLSPAINTHLLPSVMGDLREYEDALFALVQHARIDVIFPLSDLDLELLAARKAAFQAAGCKVVVSSSEVVARCNDKRQTFEFCRAQGLPTPDCWFEVSRYEGVFPAIQKHIRGSGSSGLARIESASNLDSFIAGRDMLQTLIEGDEFGLDVLNDLNGDCLAVCVKRKLLMRAGETDKAELVENDALTALGRRIAAAFRHVGNLDCDVLRDGDGKLYCIDFNPRFGGGYPATHLAGFDYLRALLNMIRGDPVMLPERPKRIVVMKGISLHWCEAV